MKATFIKAIKSPNGTSFYNGYIRASYNDLVKIFGRHHYGDFYDKVSFEWDLLHKESNITFTIHDWKEYNNYPVNNKNAIYDFYIGTLTEDETNIIVNALCDIGFNAYVEKFH